MDNKRKDERVRVNITTIVKKERPSGGYAIMEFRSINLSLGGVFISTEDISLFQLGEEMIILVDTGGTRYYEGLARVVRSARIFSEEESQVESGFGLMFINPNKELKELLQQKLGLG